MNRFASNHRIPPRATQLWHANGRAVVAQPVVSRPAERVSSNGTSTASVNIGPVVDTLDANQVLIVNAVDNAVAAATGSVPTDERQMKWPADAMWIGCEGAVHELSDGGHDLLR